MFKLTGTHNSSNNFHTETASL
uniref:Uncharacterized protein n=1 Tax=Arundo donax TaxID=35708 RepID=A0A0A9ETD3_ARUDO